MLSGANGNALVKTAFKSVKPILRLVCTNVHTYKQTEKQIQSLKIFFLDSIAFIKPIYLWTKVL